MEHEEYYEHVRSVYDRIAPQYDEAVGRHAVSRRAKQLALHVIKGVTPDGGRLLDVGCYTGIEAVLLAEQGYHVLGVDLSPEMVHKAQEKARRRRLEDRASFRVMRAADIGLLVSEKTGAFDTVYSVYGTLNLEPDLPRFKEGLVSLMRDSSRFVCGLLNPTVMYELVMAPFFGKFHGYRKLRKQEVVTRVGLGDDTVKASLYSVDDVRTLMAPELQLERILGVHILYPPPRGSQGHGRWWLARALDEVELRLQSRFPFRNFGFFSLLVFRRAAA